MKETYKLIVTLLDEVEYEGLIAKVNNKIYINSYSVSPSVDIYMNDYNSGIDERKLKKQIGNIIKTHLNSDLINIDNIKNDIIALYPNDIVGCSVYNLSDSDIDRYKYYNNSRKLVIDKKLTLTDTNEILIEYNINLKIKIL